MTFAGPILYIDEGGAVSGRLGVDQIHTGTISTTARRGKHKAEGRCSYFHSSRALACDGQAKSEDIIILGPGPNVDVDVDKAG